MFLATALLIITATHSSEPLTGPAYEVSADRETITRHAVGCVNQHASSGWTDIPTIKSSDPAVGTVVAINYLKAAPGSLLNRDMRTSLRVDAREGRFRIVHDDFELFSEWRLEWSPIDRDDRNWTGLERRLLQQSEDIATCIREAVADW